MDLGGISQEKIHNALRSLYRYRKLTEIDAPDILVESESKLLVEKFALLNAQEIFELVQIWQQYLAQQSAIEIMDEKRFKQYLENIN